MHVELLYFDDCPNRRVAEKRLREAVARTGRADVSVSLRQVTTHEDAVASRFRGSPTFLMDGRDPFDAPGVGFGLSCRVYPGTAGPSGCPTLDELVRILS